MRLPLLLLLLALAPFASAQSPATRQPHDALVRVAEHFLQTETAGLPGRVTFKVGAPEARLVLAACPAPQAFLAPGARAWGKISVGVRCTGPVLWTVYLPAQVSVYGQYVVAAALLAQGQPLTEQQLMLAEGDLTALPAGIITDLAQAVGRSPTVSLAAGTPLRSDSLKSRPLVQQGQTVRLVSSGRNFTVSAEGKALNTAGEGQVVQVRTAGGSVVAGTARSAGVVEVGF